MITQELIRSTPYVLQFLFEGQVFNTRYQGSLGASSTEHIQIKTNGGRILHLIDYLINSNSEDLTFSLIEGATVTDGTTIITTHNYNRRSTKTSDSIVYSDPTGISGGEVIALKRIFGVQQTGNRNSSSDGGDLFIERLLKQGEDYLVKIDNNSTNPIEYNLNLIWYESSN